MCSVGDVKDIVHLFPPQKTSDFLPSLILSPGGGGFVTLDSVKAQLGSRVAKAPERILLRSLADDLDVDPDLVRRLVRTHPALALLSADNHSIVTIDERAVILRKLNDGLSSGVIQRSKFAAEIHLDDNSVNALLKDVKGEVVDHDGHIFNKSYEQKVSDVIGDSLQSSLSSFSTVDIIPQNLPGAPPLWFALRVLRDVLNSHNLTDAYLVKENSDGAQCYPKKLIELNRDTVIAELRSGKLAYVDLQIFQNDFPESCSNISDATEYVRTAAEVDIVDTFAVSKANRSRVIKAGTTSLAEEGRVHLTQVLVEFPESLRSCMLQDLVRDIIASYQEESGTQALGVGDFLLRAESYDSERRVLFDYADVDASLQWQQLQEKPEKEVRYNLANIKGLITKEQLILGTLVKEKAIEKAVEERFWASIARRESQNEAQFSDFWIERVQSKCQIYKAGLDTVVDKKLRDQLSEVFTIHAKKELIPESITKARSQGLVLSRKCRKNITAIEDSLKQEDTSIASVLAALKKFNKKQVIEALNDAKAHEAKQNMVNDMIRRMQKQKKSDGPVLFLTLVLILFAKYNDGVVYATGKFAPKLLKQLKTVLPAEQYEQMEKWKEAAKTSSLTAEDRTAMKGMAET